MLQVSYAGIVKLLFFISCHKTDHSVNIYLYAVALRQTNYILHQTCGDGAPAQLSGIMEPSPKYVFISQTFFGHFQTVLNIPKIECTK